MVSKNNTVTFLGEITEEPKYSHGIKNKSFYKSKIQIQRESGVYDIIPIMLSDEFLNVHAGDFVSINGTFRSYNKHDSNGKTHLVLFVFVNELNIENVLFIGEKSNQVNINGYICKEPKHRITPLGREIADVILEVSRPSKKSDYFPCIFWSNNAKRVSELPVGTNITISGRIQSRNYEKKYSDGTSEIKVAYEISVSSFKIEKEN